jgi:hypothetical protein
LTSCNNVSFSRRTLLNGVRKYVSQYITVTEKPRILLMEAHVFFADRQKREIKSFPKSQSFSISRKVQTVARPYTCHFSLEATSKTHYVANNTRYNTDTIHRMFKKLFTSVSNVKCMSGSKKPHDGDRRRTNRVLYKVLPIPESKFCYFYVFLFYL